MQNYKMLLQYEGTRYNGWQKQGNTPDTIQGIIEALLGEINGSPVELNGSGRTDAGVHAAEQCASFKLDTDTDCTLLKTELNRLLKKDIRILSIEKADPRFHARLNAKEKTYIYRICTDEKADVFTRHFTYLYPCCVDMQKMKRAAALLTGRHDFKAFCSDRRTKKSTVREIYSIDTELEGKLLWMRFTGSGFLYNMVRIMSGTLLKVGTGEMQPDDMTAVLESLDRKNAGPTLPSSGLTLQNVRY